VAQGAAWCSFRADQGSSSADAGRDFGGSIMTADLTKLSALAVNRKRTRRCVLALPLVLAIQSTKTLAETPSDPSSVRHR
jgi:hypothetical protein